MATEFFEVCAWDGSHHSDLHLTELFHSPPHKNKRMGLGSL